MTATGPAAGGAVARARDITSLLDALQASDPGRPRLTWYGPDGERIELSARVLANWVVKTANLLGDDLGIEPGDAVALDLPGHWRTTVWQLAAAVVGAETVPAGAVGAAGAADLVVRCDPSTVGPGEVLVTLPALARSAPALPPGVVDYNAEVGGQPDVLVVATAPLPLPPLVPAAIPSDAAPRAALPEAALQEAAAPGPPRVLVGLSHGSSPALAEVVLPTWREDGSVVLVHPGVDPERLLTAENVTRRWGGTPGVS